ncbi:MAG: tRNA pseudouridine(55) synthase TruB [Flavobacteriales bacterium]|nr:MAG: tRNA pseudouridine(55) synthase TruB [Flavobacteriales bacterium]
MPEQVPNKFQTGQIILINKPLTWTSFDVVNKVRWLIRKEYNLKKIKVGHAGTLDPLATGLLILCTGKFTKKINDIQTQEKEYAGVITLGATTASYDLEKEIDIEYSTEHITEDLIKETAKTFIGEQDQIAPIYSAKKIDGKRAYEYAREGDEVKIKSNKIIIKEFEVETCDTPKLVIGDDEKSKINQEKPYEKGVHFKFRIVCSKGTYIRAIARDFGEKLNSGGHLSQLKRTKIGELKIEDAIQIEEVKSLFI